VKNKKTGTAKEAEPNFLDWAGGMTAKEPKIDPKFKYTGDR
jgi:hypothetical protein